MDVMVKNELHGFFKNKRILITGDTGFKGSWLSFWLNYLGSEIMGYALPPEREFDHFNLIRLDLLIKHKDGDVRDYSFLKKTIDDFRPEIIFHLAAQPIVTLSYKEPKQTMDTNVGGAINLLEAIRLCDSVKSLVFVTSDKCYKNKEWIWGYRENDELGGRDPYSASKSAAEIVFYTYQKSFFEKYNKIGVASARAGNVIGGGDWAVDRIVPDCIRSLSEENPIVVRNPNATRPWQHVLEPLYGYILLAMKLFNEPEKFSGSWNFGPQQDSFKPVNNLVEKIIEFWGDGSIEYQINPNAPHESNLLHLNCDKSNQNLKWLPCWNFDKTIMETIRWYKEFTNGKNISDLSKSQIKEYMET